MEALIYNNIILRKHSLSQKCLSTLYDVSCRDYGNTYYFNPDIECLDIDTYEKKLRKGSPSHTGDAVIGISTYKDNTANNPRLLIIELRMGYSNPTNLSYSEIADKISYTRSLLGGEVTIDEESVLIFNDNVVSRAKNWLNRRSKTCAELRKCIACSVSDFNSMVKSPKDFPYNPINSKEKIIISILQHTGNSTNTEQIEQIRFWCKEAESYRLKYNLPEFQHMTKVLAEIWSSLKANPANYTEDEILEMQITEEDFEFLIKSPHDL